MTNEKPLGQLHGAFDNAIRYWEPRRIAYNAVLTLVVAAWVIVSWPHFRQSVTLHSLLLMTILATIANLCYCAAYLPDIAFQLSSFQSPWRRWRGALWVAGMLFATLLANYWIADEIYPYVR